MISINDTSGTINAYNNVKGLNRTFNACTDHFLVIHTATKFIQHGIIGHLIDICTVLICICLEMSLKNKVVYERETERDRERQRERVLVASI